MAKQKRNLTEEEKIEIQKSKDELNEYRESIKYIEEKLNDTEEVKAQLEKVTATLSLSKTNYSTGNSDKFGDAISKLEELKKNYTEKMQELLIKKFNIDDKIEKVKQPYRNILFYRYARGKNWNDVADELGYTRDYVCELHGEALYLYSKGQKI